MSRTVALLILAILAIPLSGCVDQGTPVVETAMAKDTIKWGQAAQLTIRNTGDGPLPAPVTVVVRSSNGTVVRTYEDITNGAGIPVNGQVSLSWAGVNDADEPVLWGNYTMEVVGHSVARRVELLRPPHHAITIDPIPREVQAGRSMTFRINNTGTTWVNGTMAVTAGREELILYTADAPVVLAPGQGRSFLWNGKAPDGSTPEAQKYLVAVRVEPDAGPTPFAQDVFTLT